MDGKTQAMIVIHGIWVPTQEEAPSGTFFLWGETFIVAPVRSRTPLRSRRGRPGKRSSTQARLHPFLASPKEVLEGLLSMTAGEGGEWEASLSQTATHTLVLPTIGDAPLASPGLISEEAPEDEVEPRALVLLPWEIQGIALFAVQVVSLLYLLPEGRVADGRPAAMPGAFLRFWSMVSKFAMELLARQRFLPSVTSHDRGKAERFTAIWLPPIEDTSESQRVALLADAMPPLCRALVSCRAGEAPSTPPAALIIDMLNKEFIL